MEKLKTILEQLRIPIDAELEAEAEEILARCPPLTVDLGPPHSRPEIYTQRMDQIPEDRVEWLVKPWFPLGMITAIHGDPGVGKSAAITDLVARISKGAEMPNTARAPAASVLMLIGDDDLAKTVKPRLTAAGADLTRITVMIERHDFDDDGFHTEPRPIPLIRDLPLIRDQVLKTDAKLLVVDPLLAFFGAERDTNSVSDVADAMYQLKLLAEETGAAILLNTWNSKSGTGKALARLMGSQAFSGVARVAFLIEEHPETPDLLVFACSKMNVAKKPTSQTFRVVGTRVQSDRFGEVETAAIQWEGATDLRADELGNAKQKTMVAEAEAFIRGLLSDGPKPFAEIQADAEDAGIGRSALDRLKSTGRIVVTRTQDFPAKTFWALPTTPPG